MAEESKFWYFENVDLYQILCPHKVGGMKDTHSFNHYNKGDFVYFNQEPSDHVYMISSGRIKLGTYTDDGKEVIKTILSKGDLFGEMALTGEEKRNEFAQVMDNDTSVCPMGIDELEALMKDNRPLSLKIFKIIGLRIKKLERRIESLVYKDARTRIVEFIKEMGEERGQKVGFETMIKNHLTHKDIANLTGTSRQTVTTVMNELKEKNLINFNRRQILIRDMDKLA